MHHHPALMKEFYTASFCLDFKILINMCFRFRMSTITSLIDYILFNLISISHACKQYKIRKQVEEKSSSEIVRVERERKGVIE